MQTIIGSGGSIGIPLARELKAYTSDIRLVSRNPKKVNETDELFPLDVTDLDQIEKAIAGSEVVYVTIGFKYTIKVWRSTWPPFMKAVIDACKKHQAKLVFLDNVYMYARSEIPHMTEESLIQPPSKKGEVRRQLHQMIMDEVKNNTLTALIARSADFYGPDNKNSPLGIMVAENLIKGKKVQVFGDVNRLHVYTYTPDAAKATALLGNTSDAYNQVWHLPTTSDRLTTMEWIRLVADEVNAAPRIQVISTWMLKLLGVFSPMMNEFPEMNYQYEHDYVFDSTKFEKKFDFKVTKPEEGVKRMVEDMKGVD